MTLVNFHSDGKEDNDSDMLNNLLLGIDPSTYRKKLMAEIYLDIPVVYHDLTLLLYYLSHFTVS